MGIGAVAFTHSGYSNQPAWLTGDRTDCLSSSGHSDGSHQGIGVITGEPVAFAVDTYNQAIGDVSIPVRVGNGKDSLPAVAVPFIDPIAFTQNQRDEVRELKVVGALAAEPGMEQQTFVAQPAASAPPVGAMQGMAVRRLTPRECERLQGFPDDYTAITFKGKPAADGPRYKALGNSMAVPVMRWIGERIALVERLVP